MQESPQAEWVHMIMDRLHKLEQENVELRRELNLRLPELYITPCSNYIGFNDGSDLEWWIVEKKQRLCWQKNDAEEWQDIDEEHLNARMFTGCVDLSIDLRHIGLRKYQFTIEGDARGITVKKFIESTENMLEAALTSEQLTCLKKDDTLPLYGGLKPNILSSGLEMTVHY